MTPTLALAALLLAPAPYQWKGPAPPPDIDVSKAGTDGELIDPSKLWVFVRFVDDSGKRDVSFDGGQADDSEADESTDDSEADDPPPDPEDDEPPDTGPGTDDESADEPEDDGPTNTEPVDDEPLMDDELPDECDFLEEDAIDRIRVWGLGNTNEVSVEAAQTIVDLAEHTPEFDQRYGFLELTHPEDDDEAFQREAREALSKLCNIARDSPEHLGFVATTDQDRDKQRLDPDPSVERELIAKRFFFGREAALEPFHTLDRDKCRLDPEDCTTPWIRQLDVEDTIMDSALSALVGDREHATQILTGEIERFRSLLIIEELKSMLTEDPRWNYSWRRRSHPKDLAKALRRVRRSNHELRHIRKQHQLIRALNTTLNANRDHQLDRMLDKIENMIRYNNLCVHHLQDGRACPRSTKSDIDRSHRYYYAERHASDEAIGRRILARYEAHLSTLDSTIVARIKELAEQGIDPFLPPPSKVPSEDERMRLREIAIDAALRRVLVAPGDGTRIDPRDPIEHLRTVAIPELRKLVLEDLQTPHESPNAPDTLLDRGNVLYRAAPADPGFRISAFYLISSTYFQRWDWKRGYLSYETLQGRDQYVSMTEAARWDCEPDDDCPVARIRTEKGINQFFDIPENIEPGQMWLGADQTRLQLVFDDVAIAVEYSVSFSAETNAERIFLKKWFDSQSHILDRPYFNIKCGEKTIREIYHIAIPHMVDMTRNWQVPEKLNIQCDRTGATTGYTIVPHTGALKSENLSSPHGRTPPGAAEPHSTPTTSRAWKR